MPADRPVFASPGDLPAPAGYSHVVTIPAGRLVWTSGQVGLDADGRPGDGWEEQTRLAFANVGRALAAAGATWNDVVKLTYFVVATDALETVRAVRDEFVDTAAPPTSSLVRVAGCSGLTSSSRSRPSPPCPAERAGAATGWCSSGAGPRCRRPRA